MPPATWERGPVDPDANVEPQVSAFYKKRRLLRRDQPLTPDSPIRERTTEPGYAAAFVSAAGHEKDFNTLNTGRNYVIIGRGFTAIVNHSTLLQSKWGQERLAGLSVVYLGFPDPWPGYVTHNMNQDAMLLIHPGFVHPPGDRPVDATFLLNWMRSDQFGRLTRDETEEIRRFQIGHPPKIIEGFVADVRKVDGRNDQYKIRYFDKKDLEQWQDQAEECIRRKQTPTPLTPDSWRNHHIYAKYVDICSGPGVAKVVNIGLPDNDNRVKRYNILMSPQLEMELLKLSPEKQRIFAASDYVRRFTDVPSGTRVCIQGLNTPAGVQAMERAFGLDYSGGKAGSVFGFASAGLEGGFPPNGRLDKLAGIQQGVTLLPRAPAAETRDSAIFRGQPLTQSVLYPGEGLNGRDVVFGHGYRISEITEITPEVSGRFGLGAERPGALLVRFRDTGNMRPRLTNTFSDFEDYNGAREPRFIEYGVFDQVVICGGQQTGQDEPGSPLAIIKELATDQDDFDKLRTIKAEDEDYDHPLGLRVEGEGEEYNPTIRVLGGAAHGSRIMVDRFDDDLVELIYYENNLPIQARVLQRGVTLAAVTIAQANLYFHGVRWVNTNVNTSTWDDLWECVDPHADARPIQAVRAKSRNGFADKNALALALAFRATYPRVVDEPEFLFYRNEGGDLCIGGVARAGCTVEEWVLDAERVDFDNHHRRFMQGLKKDGRDVLIYLYDPGVYGGSTYKKRYDDARAMVVI